MMIVGHGKLLETAASTGVVDVWEGVVEEHKIRGLLKKVTTVSFLLCSVPT